MNQNQNKDFETDNAYKLPRCVSFRKAKNKCSQKKESLKNLLALRWLNL